MPSFNIVKTTNPQKTFRTESVIGSFDLHVSSLQQCFKGNIDIEGKDWNIGLIVGSSGSGKSTIAKEIFGKDYFQDHKYGANAIVDEMPKNKSMSDIEKAFTSVGFASPPSWLKPYSVLSNGEKMRVDIAYCLLNEKPLVVFDEFTSVVNRQVAKTASVAINKAIKKTEKKFVAISCHDDIIEYLQPDWIYNTDEQKFFFCKEWEKPKFELQIFELRNSDKQRIWETFKRYHYLNTELMKTAKCFVALMNNELVAFNSYIQTPMRKGYKRTHRLVVLPDYQGLGIATAFLNWTGDMLKKQGFVYTITSSQPSLLYALKKQPHWLLKRIGHASPQKGYNTKNYWINGTSNLRNSESAKRRTFTFVYK